MGSRAVVSTGVLLAVGLAGATVRAATIDAASCDRTDVVAAIGSAVDGDVVAVPAGQCTWSSMIPVERAIEITGAGIDGTVITDHGFQVADGTDDWRISGFTFTTTDDQLAAIALGEWKSADGCRGFRIDHNKVDGYHYGIDVDGWCSGVIDHNEILKGGISYNGDDDAAWERDSALGTEDFVFVEDNLFSNDGVDNELHVITNNRGARVVFRYNRIEESGHYIADAFDTHGYCHGPNDRGTRAFEIYGNTFVRAGNGCCRALFLRGGTGVVFDNVFDETLGGYHWNGAHVPIFLVDYRAAEWAGTSDTCPSQCSTAQWCDTGEGDPCCDQIGRGMNQQDDPAYFWNNADHQGTAILPAVAADADWAITEGEDYINLEKPGYVAYTYPHPLVADGGAGGGGAGSGAGGGSGGNGGNGGTSSGGAAAGGTGAGAPPAAREDDSSCGCRLPGERRSSRRSGWAWMVFGLVVSAAARRRVPPSVRFVLASWPIRAKC